MSDQQSRARGASTSHVDGIDLGTMINIVKSALLLDAQDNPDPLYDLKSVELELQTVASGEATVGGEFKLIIVDIEASVTVKAEEIQTIKLKVVPPKPRKSTLESIPGLRDTLVKGIQVIRDGLAVARQGPLPLDLDSASVELKFTVSREGSLKLVVVGGKVNTASVQTATLTLKRIGASDEDEEGS